MTTRDLVGVLLLVCSVGALLALRYWQCYVLVVCYW